jgi:hypothetical protein
LREGLIFWLNSRYSVDQLSDELFKLTLETSNSRAQIVLVSVWRENFTVMSPIAPYIAKNAGTVLEAVADSTVLGVSVFNSFFVITSSSTSLDGPVLDSLIDAVGETADEIEALLTRGADNL